MGGDGERDDGVGRGWEGVTERGMTEWGGVGWCGASGCARLVAGQWCGKKFVIWAWLCVVVWRGLVMGL